MARAQLLYYMRVLPIIIMMEYSAVWSVHEVASSSLAIPTNTKNPIK